VDARLQTVGDRGQDGGDRAVLAAGQGGALPQDLLHALQRGGDLSRLVDRHRSAYRCLQVAVSANVAAAASTTQTEAGVLTEAHCA
jgi:hypothetical protein